MFSKYYKEIVELAVQSGLIMLEANAECHRVENTVYHILSTSGLPNIDVFANTTGLFVTLDGPNLNEPLTFVKRITNRQTNLSRIHEVNQISRDIVNGNITLDKAKRKLKHLKRTDYSNISRSISMIFLVLSFTILFGGTSNELLLSFLAALLLLFSYSLRKYIVMNDFIFSLLSTMIVSVVIPLVIFYFEQPSHLFNIVISSVLMPLFPGTAFTNGIRDTLKGDYGSGVAKIVEALIIAVSLGLGVVIGLYIVGY